MYGIARQQINILRAHRLNGPAKSVPIASGHIDRVNVFMSPSRLFQPSGSIEAAATRTPNVLAFGPGSEKGARCTSSGPP